MDSSAYGAALKVLVSKQLGDDQMVKAVPGSVFMRYPDLKRFDTVDDVLAQSPIQVIFILYLVENANEGHYTVLFRRPDAVIEFFDPYGYRTDSEMRFVAPSKRKALGEDTPVLLRLLLNSPGHERWTFNSFDLQSHDPATQDCGRWCIWRATQRALTDDQFHALVKNAARAFGGDFDLACVSVTAPLLREKL